MEIEPTPKAWRRLERKLDAHRHRGRVQPQGIPVPSRHPSLEPAVEIEAAARCRGFGCPDQAFGLGPGIEDMRRHAKGASPEVPHAEDARHRPGNTSSSRTSWMFHSKTLAGAAGPPR